MDRSIAPEISNKVSLSTLPVENITLDNGIQINSVNGGSQEILKVELIFNSGTKHQSKPLVASIGYDLLREGTTRLTGNEFTEAIDLLGGFLSTESSKDFGTVTLYILNKYLEESVALITEMLTSPRFDSTDFDRLLENQKNNFLINQEKTGFLAKQKLTERLYGDCEYGRVAHLSSFDELTLEDVKLFMNSHVVGSPFKVLISGKVRTEDVDVLKSSFGALKITNEDDTLKVGNIVSETGVFKIEKDNEQCSLSIGKMMPNKDHKDSHKISIVNTFFGGYFGSRLMQNIREDKGWTYGISSSVFAYVDGASLMISGDVLKDKGPESLDEIKKEMERLQNEPVSEKEISLVRNYLKGKLLKSFDGAFEQADRFFTIDTFGMDWSYYDEYLAELDNITADDIQEIAKKYFKYEDLVIVTAG